MEHDIAMPPFSQTLRLAVDHRSPKEKLTRERRNRDSQGTCSRYRLGDDA
jgi:hypothetical protein